MSPASKNKTSAGTRQRQASATAARSPKPKGKTKQPKGKTKQQKNRRPRNSNTREARKRASGLIDPRVNVLTKDPLRIQIVAIATQRPTSPSEFAREAGITVNMAAYHFKVLREHSYLEIVEEAPVRGSIKHVHIATDRAYVSDTDWGQLDQALRPGVAGAALQDFNSRVAQAMETGTFFERNDTCLHWAPHNLDGIAWGELVEMIAWCVEESKRLEVETVERAAAGENTGSFPATFAIACFVSPTTSQIKEARGGQKPQAKQDQREAKSKQKPKTKRTRKPVTGKRKHGS